MRKTLNCVGIAGALALGISSTAQAQSDVNRQLGSVHFQTSCNEVAQQRFDRAMRYQHSFWYRASRQVFEEALKADPNCAIAYWGIALGLWDNPHNPPPAPNLAPALVAIEKGQALGAKTQRERDYIDALAVLYKDHDKTPYRPRLMAHLKAMEALAQKYPNDDEAQISYSIILNVSASPADKTYAQQLKGAAILEPIAKRQPSHPGVIHYLIHLYDYPALAQKGLDAANRYAKIAPAAPHAQHMPSHIYTRVGLWRESIASNIESVKAARAEKESPSQLHGWDYMVYAYLQLGRDKEARAVIDEMTKVTGINPNAFGAFFALAASPARFAFERGDWNAAVQLPVQSSRFPQAMAITHFARALGAARTNKPDAANSEIAKLAELRDKLRAAKVAYWAEQVEIQRQIASAWLLNAQGKHEEALKAMSAAADIEDKTEKHPVTPGPLAPARELYAEMLLMRGKANEALAAFEATKVKEPNRFHGYAGAAKAAEKLGNRAIAKANYEKLVAMTSATVAAGPQLAATDVERPELIAAREFLAKN